jgi:hypothetical protein
MKVSIQPLSFSALSFEGLLLVKHTLRKEQGVNQIGVISEVLLLEVYINLKK